MNIGPMLCGGYKILNIVFASFIKIKIQFFTSFKDLVDLNNVDNNVIN